MDRSRRRDRRRKCALLLVSLVAALAIVECGYRLFDPFPHFPAWQINHTEHGNLSQFDATLGWKGVPSAREWFVTDNARILLEHNRAGFRDVEPEGRSPDAPALVFLGDSFTWGYEVEADAMFVNLVRRCLPRFEVWNLAHRGYGTDQSLLTFRAWTERPAVELVVLMFTENDMWENGRDYLYGKHKPKFEVVDDRLILTGVPVERTADWARPPAAGRASLRERAVDLLFRSHFLHDLDFRRKLLAGSADDVDPVEACERQDPTITRAILRELGELSRSRGGRLIVVAVPSKLQFMAVLPCDPYQEQLRGLCAELGLDYLDLAPDFERAVRRTYFRRGMHWNARGHALAARAICRHLGPEPDR
jgi:lysophospholipase L1-like esterase